MAVQVTRSVINYRITFYLYLASGCSFLLSDWNLSFKQDSQSSVSQYLVYHASRIYFKAYKREAGIDGFGV